VRLSLVLITTLLLAACSKAAAPKPVFHASENPKQLSDWGLLAPQSGKLVLGEGSFQYQLNSALFSDYALKLRTISLPEGAEVTIEPQGDALEFPVGPVITKTFYYPKGAEAGEVLKTTQEAELVDNTLDMSDLRLIETRLLIRRDDGWAALPYVWNDEQTEATLQRIGDLKKLTLVDGETKSEFPYLVPNVNQCAGCHATNNTTRNVVPIGPKVRHLTSMDNFRLKEDISSYIQNVSWEDTTASLEDRARAYLDINCSHCHNEVGPADTSGLHLTPGTKIGPHLGVCKTPIAAGTGTGNRKFGIVPGEPEESIFMYRLDSTNPAVMMPELGRSLAHAEGVALISEWIDTLEGDCAG